MSVCVCVCVCLSVCGVCVCVCVSTPDEVLFSGVRGQQVQCLCFIRSNLVQPGGFTPA